MPKPSLPNPIKLLQFIADHITECESLFDPNSASHQYLTNSIHTTSNLLEDPNLPEDIVIFIQILLLSTLSLIDGLESKLISNITTSQNTISIFWGPTIQTQLTVGKNNASLTSFIAQVFTKVFTKKRTNAAINKSSLSLIQNLLQHHSEKLADSIQRINQIGANKTQLIDAIKSEENNDLFFIILSSLPGEQLNALYLHIQQFFPEDAELKTPSGHVVNLKQFFQIPSQDVYFLIDKIKMHFNVFFYSESEDIRTTIQEETIKYLDQLLTNTDYFESTITTITDTRDQYLAIQQSLLVFLSKTIHKFTGSHAISRL